MKICTTCGNEIPFEAVRCQYCESDQAPQGASVRGSGREKIKTVNLKQGLPFVDEALDRLSRELELARSQGVKVVRIIHGYGSSGTGGGIRQAVLQELAGLARAGRVKTYVPGGEYSEHTRAGRDLLRRFPGLRSELVTDRENPGITLVQL